MKAPDSGAFFVLHSTIRFSKEQETEMNTFVLHAEDIRFGEIKAALEGDGQNILVVMGEDPLEYNHGDVYAAVFTQGKVYGEGKDRVVLPGPSLKRGGSSRLASHKIQGPKWSAGCQFLIALHPRSKSPPSKLVTRWTGVLEEFGNPGRLGRVAPWGCLPTDQDNFAAYVEWVRQVGLDPDELGLKWSPKPQNRLSKQEVRTWRRQLTSGGLTKGLVESVIRSIQLFPADIPVSEKRVLRVVKQFKVLLATHFKVNEGQQVEQILAVLWRALAGQPIQVVAPVCPAWTYNDQGYTFCGLEPGSRGVCYDMFTPGLSAFVQFCREAGLDFQADILVGDIEWFDIDEYRSLQGMTRERFMGQVAEQVALIRADLEARCIRGTVRGFLQAIPEDHYVTTRAAKRAEYVGMLGRSGWIQRHFTYVAQVEAPLYAKQCGVAVNPDHLSPEVREAVVDDVSHYLTFSHLLAREVHRGSNVLFLVQSDPFTVLYKDYAYMPWKPRTGAF